jgi:hypothetical protein
MEWIDDNGGKLKNHKIMGAPTKLLLSVNKSVQKILVSKQNIYITDKTKENNRVVQ